MEFKFTKEVAERMAELEDGHHVGAGSLALEMYQRMGLLSVDFEKFGISFSFFIPVFPSNI